VKKLIWQYNVKSERSYDQGFEEIARCSIETVKRYASKIGADHVIETVPTLFDDTRNFPGVDFFTFMKDSRYNNYDFLIKFDADFLIGPKFPDLSQTHYRYVGLAAYGRSSWRDKWYEVHERTWSNFNLDFDKWASNYVLAGLAGFPKSTKQWLTETIDDKVVESFTHCKNPTMIQRDKNFKWSITEQSYINYLLYHAPFKVQTLHYPMKPSLLTYHAGPRIPQQIERYKKLTDDILKMWDTTG